MLSACTTTTGAGWQQGSSIRVVTYNIFGGHDLARQPNLERVAALIDSLQADVVLLQEVDRLTSRSGRIAQADTIARYANLQLQFGRAMDFDGGEYGIAILSRWPMQLQQLLPYAADGAVRDGGTAEPRVLLHVVVAAPGGSIHVLNTHLDHRAASPLRRQQVLEALAYIAEAVPRDAAVVFGGDLNAVPEASEVRALAIRFDDAWLSCGDGSGFTFRSDAPDRRIDYIKLAGACCTNARVIETPVSDHLPLVVDVSLGAACRAAD